MRHSFVASALLAVTVMTSSVAIGDDNQIARQIVQRLRQEQTAGNLKGFGVDLKVVDGVVMLRGRVSSTRQEQLVQQIAASAPGVKGVQKQISVAPQAAGAVAAPVSSRRARNANRGPFAGGTHAVSLAQKQTPVLAPIPAPPSAPRQQPRLIPAMIAVPVAAAPQYAPQRYAAQRPVAFAQTAYNAGGQYGSPAPAAMAGHGGPAHARYDHPNLPAYSWPSYAAHPNYAAVTYPKQYSPSAWPYIGPFYPYPQVPLGWRKVTLEWDDGWWQLDFKNKRHR